MLSSLFPKSGPRRALIYFRESEIWLQPCLSPAPGLWLPGPPLQVLAGTTPFTVLADAAHKVLKLSEAGDWSIMPANPLSSRLGSGWAQLYVKTRQLALEREQQSVSVVPHLTMADRFIPLDAQRLSLPKNPRDWAPILEQSLQLCRTGLAHPKDKPTSKGPLPFGNKCSWLALPSDHLDSTLAMLPLLQPQRAGWKEGLHQAQGGTGRVYLTPPLPHAPGWALLVGDLPLPRHPQDPILSSFARALQSFPQSHLLASHRGSDYGIWVYWQQGKLERARVEGEDPWTWGLPDPREQGLDLSRPEGLLQLAGRVSLNPALLTPQARFASGVLARWANSQE